MIEVNRPDRADRRRRGKTDAIDAEAAARAVLSGRATAVAKTGDGPVEMLRMFKLAKASAVKSRTQAINQLKAVLRRRRPCPARAADRAEHPTALRACAAARGHRRHRRHRQAAAAYTLRLLAQRITLLTEEIDDLNARITAVLALTPRNCCSATASAPTPPPPCSSPPATIPTGSTAKPPSPRSAGSARSRRPLARPSDADSTAAATGRPTPPSPHHARPPALGPTTRDYVERRVRRGQDPTRGHPLPQALHRPRDLPLLTPHREPASNLRPHRRLTSIGASSATSSGAAPSTSPRSGPGSATRSPPDYGTRPSRASQSLQTITAGQGQLRQLRQSRQGYRCECPNGP